MPARGRHPYLASRGSLEYIHHFSSGGTLPALTREAGRDGGREGGGGIGERRSCRRRRRRRRRAQIEQKLEYTIVVGAAAAETLHRPYLLSIITRDHTLLPVPAAIADLRGSRVRVAGNTGEAGNIVPSLVGSNGAVGGRTNMEGVAHYPLFDASFTVPTFPSSSPSAWPARHQTAQRGLEEHDYRAVLTTQRPQQGSKAVCCVRPGQSWAEVDVLDQESPPRRSAHAPSPPFGHNSEDGFTIAIALPL